MTYGPVELVAFAVKGTNPPREEIINSLLELVEGGFVRIIDVAVVMKDQNGEVTMREVADLDPRVRAVFDPLKAAVIGMISDQDLDMVADAMENESMAAVLLFENLWALKFKEAVVKANGRMVFQERIPHEVVEEAVAEMAALREAAE